MQAARLRPEHVTRGRRPVDTLELTNAMQISAVRGHIRSKILVALSRGQASAKELAATLSIPRGTAAYNLRILQEAGLVYVAATRRVRAVTERYYARTARNFAVAGGDDPAVSALAAASRLVAEFAGDLDTPAPIGPTIRRVNLTAGAAAELVARMHELIDGYEDSDVPSAGAVGVIAGAFRVRTVDDRPSSTSSTRHHLVIL